MIQNNGCFGISNSYFCLRAEAKPIKIIFDLVVPHARRRRHYLEGDLVVSIFALCKMFPLAQKFLRMRTAHSENANIEEVEEFGFCYAYLIDRSDIVHSGQE